MNSMRMVSMRTYPWRELWADGQVQAARVLQDKQSIEKHIGVLGELAARLLLQELGAGC